MKSGIYVRDARDRFVTLEGDVPTFWNTANGILPFESREQADAALQRIRQVYPDDAFRTVEFE